MRQKSIDENYEGPYDREAIDWDGRHHHTPPFNINRWLESHVGEPWDEVYSKLCKKFPRPKDRHLWIDNNYRVQLDCTEKDGKILDSRGHTPYNTLVVVDGILRKIPWRRLRPTETAEQIREKRGFRWVNGKVYAKLNNCWFELTLEEDKFQNISGHLRRSFDVFFKTSYLNNWDRQIFYGSADFVCCDKRQLNKREIKRLCLNEPLDNQDRSR